MDYINCSTIKEEEENKRKLIFDWWLKNKQLLDVVYYKTEKKDFIKNNNKVNEGYAFVKDINADYLDLIGKDFFPMLSEDDIRKIIEKVTNSKVIFEYTCMYNIVFKILKENITNGSLECNFKITFPDSKMKLIDCYWKTLSIIINSHKSLLEE